MSKKPLFFYGWIILALSFMAMALAYGARNSFSIFYSWMPYLYAIFFGLGIGINGPILGAALADMFYGKNFGSINGLILLGFGLGGIVGPWFGGFVFDATKSYFVALITAILVICVSCIFLWIAAPRKIRKLN